MLSIAPTAVPRSAAGTPDRQAVKAARMIWRADIVQDHMPARQPALREMGHHGIDRACQRQRDLTQQVDMSVHALQREVSAGRHPDFQHQTRLQIDRCCPVLRAGKPRKGSRLKGDVKLGHRAPSSSGGRSVMPVACAICMILPCPSGHLRARVTCCHPPAERLTPWKKSTCIPARSRSEMPRRIARATQRMRHAIRHNQGIPWSGAEPARRRS